MVVLSMMLGLAVLLTRHALLQEYCIGYSFWIQKYFVVENFILQLIMYLSRGMQVAQVLLTLPYSFSQLGMLSGILFQLFYGLMGSWTAYLISVLYVEYRTRKEREKVDFRNHVIQVLSLFPLLLYIG